jgi:hypothetical protein
MVQKSKWKKTNRSHFSALPAAADMGYLQQVVVELWMK